MRADMSEQHVEKIQGGWMGTCDHGETVWCIVRGTEYAAWRSLRAHATECPRANKADEMADIRTSNRPESADLSVGAEGIEA